jgi:hypothetical protein
MAQLTLDTVAERARSLANRTGDQASKAIAVVLPQRAATRAPTIGLARMMRRPRRAPVGMRMQRRIPLPVRLAWRSGKATGRVQGMAAMAPAAMRGRWAEMTRRMPGRGTPSRARMVVRWVPVVLGGTRLAAQAWLRMRRNPNRLNGRQRAWTSRVPFLAGGAVAAPQGAKAMTRATTVGKARPRANVPATQQTVKDAGRTATRRALRARGGWMGYRRAQGQPRAMKARNRRLRNGWRWMRSFTIGFSTGAIWAYLFAPRQGPAYERMQQASQQSRTA